MEIVLACVAVQEFSEGDHKHITALFNAYGSGSAIAARPESLSKSSFVKLLRDANVLVSCACCCVGALAPTHASPRCRTHSASHAQWGLPRRRLMPMLASRSSMPTCWRVRR